MACVCVCIDMSLCGEQTPQGESNSLSVKFLPVVDNIFRS